MDEKHQMNGFAENYVNSTAISPPIETTSAKLEEHVENTTVLVKKLKDDQADCAEFLINGVETMQNFSTISVANGTENEEKLAKESMEKIEFADRNLDDEGKSTEHKENTDSITEEKTEICAPKNVESLPVAIASLKLMLPQPAELTHQVKWINFPTAGAASLIPIVTQNENGPCPLMALINVLFMRGQAQLNADVRTVTSQELLAILADCIIRMTPQELSTHRADYQRNVEDALLLLPKLITGIDVNVKFTRVDDFEYTPDCLAFDLLNIPLYHGWLVEPEHQSTAAIVGQSSYNQLAEFIIGAKCSEDQETLDNAYLAEQFLQSTASQLTYHGLCELNTNLKDGTLCVFFRNNHFSTMAKHKDELFLLVTDQGFLNEPNVVWETLNNVDGDSRFVDAEFTVVPPKQTPLTVVQSAAPLPPDASPQEQIDHDLMVALSLEEQERAAMEADQFHEAVDAGDASLSREESDRRLALKLHEQEQKMAAQEELQQQQPHASGSQQQQQQQKKSPDSSGASRRSSGDNKKDKCSIL